MPDTTPADRLWPDGNAATRGCLLITAATDPGHHAVLAGALRPADLYVLGAAAVAAVPGVRVHAVALDTLPRDAWPERLAAPDSPLRRLPDGVAPRVYDLTAGPPALRLALAENVRSHDLRFVMDDGVPHLRPVAAEPVQCATDAVEAAPATPKIGRPDAVRTAATHDHMFHADDVLAGALLRLVFPDVVFVRTRDPQRWAEADAVFDVGGRYGVGLNDTGPETGTGPHVYDHHQRGGPTRDDGKPFASFGLLWREVGGDVCAALLPDAAPEILEKTCDAFECEFVRSVDDHDNTGHSDHAGAVGVIQAIRLHGPATPPGEDTPAAAFDAAYESAVAFGIQMIRRTLYKLQVRIETVPKVEAAVAAALEQNADHLVFEFESGGAGLWSPVVHRLDPEGRLRWVTFDRGNGWIVRNVRTARGTESLFPESWRGRENQAASAATGVPGTVFVHRSGFLAVHETRAGALALIAEAGAPAAG